MSERLLAGAGRGATVLAAGLPQADIRTAALLNGIAARAVELCEGVRGLQPSPHILPGVLAIAEQRGLGGRAMLGAFVLGYEVAGRLNRGYTQRAFSHPMGSSRCSVRRRPARGSTGWTGRASAWRCASPPPC